MELIVLSVLLEFHNVMLDQPANVMLDLSQMEESALVNPDKPQLVMELLVEIVQLIVFHVLHHRNVLHVKQASPYYQVDNVLSSVNLDNMSLIPLNHQLLPPTHHQPMFHQMPRLMFHQMLRLILQQRDSYNHVLLVHLHVETVLQPLFASLVLMDSI